MINKNEFDYLSYLNSEGDTNLVTQRNQYTKNKDILTKELIDEDALYFIHQSLSTPVMDVVSSLNDEFLINTNGTKLIDFHGNSVHQLGHSNKAVVEATKKQLDVLPFVPRRYTSEISIKAAKKLVSINDISLTRVLFTPSGAASISIALKLAQNYTKKCSFISYYDSFHGANLDTIALGGERMFKESIATPSNEAIHILPYNNIDCPLGSCDGCNYKCLTLLEYQLKFHNDIAAMVIEPIRATTLHIPPNEYFLKLKDILNKHNIVLIFDEIPMALGKTSRMFVYQNYDIVPDILVLGKGLGGGVIPFSAVVCKEKFNCAKHISLGHYTHEKNPLGSAAFLAMCKEIEKNKLLDYTIKLNKYIKSELDLLVKKYNLIKNYSLIGCSFAIYLNSNKSDEILYELLNNGISIKTSHSNILLFMPPINIKESSLKYTFKQLNIILDKYRKDEYFEI